MNIFLSYSSAQKATAESICYELQAEGHEVFFDREDLPAAHGYNERIRSAIDACDLFIFLITPDSVAKGKYTLTELKLASRKWPNPSGRVLPVMLAPTPFEDIPPYLKAVTVLTPEGNVTAEILMEVEALATPGTAEPSKPGATEADLESYSYRPVEIRFGAGGAGNYPLAITESPTGSLPAEACALDPDGLERQLWSSARRVEGTLRRGAVGPGETVFGLMPSAEDARRVGEQLYASLFNSHLRACLEDSLRLVDPQHRAGLRFLINTTETPDLGRLPWEFLYNPQQEDFLFSDRMKPVIRWLDVDQPPPMLAVEPPLRLLIAIASPQDRPELGVGEEIAHLHEALSDMEKEGRVAIAHLEHTTLEKLDDALLGNKPHVLHFIGHGDFLADEGVIVLEAETPAGAADPITGRRLGVLLRNHLGSLRFVFLNNCLSAAASRRDPFGGVAQSLIRRGIPAVIAMQFPIPDQVAVTLARRFYRYLAAGLPVDTALTSARAFLYARGYEVEWAAPALHMRTPDGRLFDLGRDKDRQAAAPESGEAAEPAYRESPAAPPAPEMAEPRAAAPQRGRRWPRIAFLLLIVLAAIPVLSWLYIQFIGVVPEVIDTRPPPPPPPPPPPIDDPIPRASQEEMLYREALERMTDDDISGAIELIIMARQQDPDGTVLAGLPDVREQLVDGLVAAARARLQGGDIAAAERILEIPLSIKPGHPQGRALSDLIDSRKRYSEALETLTSGDTAAAIDLIAKAQRLDADGSALDSMPEIRTQLLDGLFATAREALLAGDTDLAERILQTPLSIEPDHPQGRAIQQKIAALAKYRQALQELSYGNTHGALGKLGEAQRADVDGSILDAQSELRTALFDGFLGAADELLAAGEVYLLIETLMALDPDRAGEALAWLFPAAAGPGYGPVRVIPGDTLWDIAAREYGDPTIWRRIYEANRGQIRDPDLIYPGQVFDIPPPEAPAPGFYRVTPGDSLWSIAETVYGDPHLWPLIYDANREQISDPDLIFPHQELAIPDRPDR